MAGLSPGRIGPTISKSSTTKLVSACSSYSAVSATDLDNGRENHSITALPKNRKADRDLLPKLGVLVVML